MTEAWTRAAFEPHVNKTFSVKGGAHALTLVRIEARPQEEWETDMGLRAPFNLIFRGPPGELLKEGLYTFEVEDGAAFDLYMMPIHTPLPGRQDYQSSFN